MTDTDDTDETEQVKVTPCGLTPEQEAKWDTTMSMMGWRCPGFQHLWYKLLANNSGKYVAVPSKSVPVAATDAKNIMINPDKFFEYTMAERVFIMAHEVVHNIYNDVGLLHKLVKRGTVPMPDGTTLPFKNRHLQVAMDWRINAVLIKSKIGKPPKDGCYNDEVDGSENILDLYRKAYEEDPDGDGGFDILLPPGASTGQSPSTAAAQHNPQRWQIEIATAQHLDKRNTAGKMSAGLSRLYDELLKPEVDWREHIQTLINRVGGSGGWNWKEPDEWWAPHEFFAPRKTGRGAGHIVIWGDTSGSRSNKEIANSISEIAGIIEDINPARLTLIWGDADITGIHELESGSDLKTLDPKGGGGTEIEPIYGWIREQISPPDLLIAFTDGYLGFPDPPQLPIIWASSTDAQYPYGEVVRVNKSGGN